MKQIMVIVIVVLCMFATFGTTYLFVNNQKEQERLELVGQHEIDISNLNVDISTLNGQISSLNEQIDNLTVKNDFYGAWYLQEIGGDGYFPSMIIIMADKTVWAGFVNEGIGNMGATVYYDYEVEDKTICFKHGSGEHRCYIYEFIEPSTEAYDKGLMLSDFGGYGEYYRSKAPYGLP